MSFFEEPSNWYSEHTPPTMTPSSYGNVLQKRARRRGLSTDDGILSDFEARGVLTSHQKSLLRSKMFQGDQDVVKALDRYDAGDASELEKIINSLLDDAERRRPPTEEPKKQQQRGGRTRAASIDLLAELDLDDEPLSNVPRKPPPSAECLGLPHDDQLMGFEMEMPFLPSVFTPTAAPPSAVVVATNHPQHATNHPHQVQQYTPPTRVDDHPRIVVRQTYDLPPSPTGSAGSSSSAHRGGQYFFDDPRFGGKVAPGKKVSGAAKKRTPQPQTPQQRSFQESPGTSPQTQHSSPSQSRRHLGGGHHHRHHAESQIQAKPRGEPSTPLRLPDTTAPQDYSQLAPAVAYQGKVSSTVSAPPPASELNADPAPPYETLVNFPRAKSRAKIHCVMCGRYPRGGGGEDSDDGLTTSSCVVVIPRQNKDVCRDCDKALWRHNDSDTHFKWCKGCKRFRNLTAFAEKLAASKCDRCRERGRQGYQRRKGTGSSPPGTPRGLHDDEI